jgi:hypothetical protein
VSEREACPEIAKGDGKRDITIETLAGGKVTELPLRDPMTMKASGTAHAEGEEKRRQTPDSAGHSQHSVDSRYLCSGHR